MAGNVVSSLSARLQEVTERFRKEQGDYLKCELHSVEGDVECFWKMLNISSTNPEYKYQLSKIYRCSDQGGEVVAVLCR